MGHYPATHRLSFCTESSTMLQPELWFVQCPNPQGGHWMADWQWRDAAADLLALREADTTDCP